MSTRRKRRLLSQVRRKRRNRYPRRRVTAREAVTVARKAVMIRRMRGTSGKSSFSMKIINLSPRVSWP